MNITEPELLKLISRGETSHVELRRELPDEDILARTICAFANTRGGRLIIGVEEDGDLCGVADPKDALSRIRLVAQEDLQPPVKLAHSSVRSGEHFLIVVQINFSQERPHSIPCGKRRREIMIRVGTINEEADGGTLNALRSHRTQEQTKDALEVRILEWVAQCEQESPESAGNASPEVFCKLANIGERRASKAFVSLECSGLLVGRGARAHRFYALP